MGANPSGGSQDPNQSMSMQGGFGGFAPALQQLWGGGMGGMGGGGWGQMGGGGWSPFANWQSGFNSVQANQPWNYYAPSLSSPYLFNQYQQNPGLIQNAYSPAAFGQFPFFYGGAGGTYSPNLLNPWAGTGAQQGSRGQNTLASQPMLQQISPGAFGGGSFMNT